MEFNIARNILLTGIRKTLGIVDKKTTMPILNNVLIRAKDDKITIIATDIETTLMINFAAEILTEGEITVSAKKLYEMIREILEGVVHVKKSDADSLIISCDKSVFRINGMAADEFPSIPSDDDAELIPIKRRILRELIVKTFFAVSTDETRPNLTGAFFTVEDKGEHGKTLKFVGTDGHRMAIAEHSVEGQVLQLDKGIIIPRKGLMEMRRILEEEEGEMFLGVHQGRFILKGQGILLKVNLIDAEYPDYRRVIPQETGTMVEFDKEMVVRALKRVNVVSSEGYGGVIISFKPGVMALWLNDPDVGEANDELPVDYHGEEMTVGYNVEYLLNAIEVIDEEGVRLEIGVDTKPSVVRGRTNDNYLCIVMPLKL